MEGEKLKYRFEGSRKKDYRLWVQLKAKANIDTCYKYLVFCFIGVSALASHLLFITNAFVSCNICPASLSLSLFIGLIAYIHVRQLYGVHYFTLDQWVWETPAVHSKDCKRAQHYDFLSGDKLSFEVEMSNKTIYETHGRAVNLNASVTECQ